MIAKELEKLAANHADQHPNEVTRRLHELSQLAAAMVTEPTEHALTVTATGLDPEQEIRAQALDAAVRWCSDHADVHAVADRFAERTRNQEAQRALEEVGPDPVERGGDDG